jgi:hypothetical protein
MVIAELRQIHKHVNTSTKYSCHLFFSTSALYSTPSKLRGTRMMLVTEVALGKCCDYVTMDTTLTQPPEGYDSVHGVGRKHDSSSAFQVIRCQTF